MGKDRGEYWKARCSAKRGGKEKQVICEAGP